MGYTGPTVFGENTRSGLCSKDPGFGQGNVRSAFGNYAEKVSKEELTAWTCFNRWKNRRKSRYGATFGSSEQECLNSEDPEDIEQVS